ncbi:putative methyltransferase-domain-containing protein [Cristinia sonorae]|uniref:Protein N-terminal and lysine N-methyltransferase EFM7 n=1 Tax=Cristinia sonorae TaxID=1940300 RepID=A0A8K0UEW8_9AGAR|nr:putative methyltransferase-domain-containing protein [Cristinia sonorae]
MPNSDNDEISLSLDDMFTEPPRPPTPPASIETYIREREPPHKDWSHIEISLVGSHPLWGHHLWNASRAFASYLDANPELTRDRVVLELGAGGGLPGLVAAKTGAKVTVLTDYPDQDLLNNLRLNVSKNELDHKDVYVEGYIWGRSVEPLFTLYRRAQDTRRFDVIVMSDLIFNHSQHDALLDTCEAALDIGTNEGPQPCLLVFYTHHRPHLAHRDMEFFERARQRGWACEEVLTRRYPPMFPNDPGEEEVRATVHGWKLTRDAQG